MDGARLLYGTIEIDSTDSLDQLINLDEASITLITDLFLSCVQFIYFKFQ